MKLPTPEGVLDAPLTDSQWSHSLIFPCLICWVSGREWEMKVQEYEDEDEDDEPSLWTRVRSLLLSLSLQFYHYLMKIREQLQGATKMLGHAANAVRQSLK